MHVLMVVGGGLALLALFLAVGRGLAGPGGLARAALVFLPVWLGASLYNMYVGVTRAGYSVAEETPILLIVFAVPAALALVARRRWG